MVICPPQRRLVAQGAPDDLSECALLYTSGTTGRPKGCILQNRYFLHAGRWYLSVGGLCVLREGEERMLTPLPVTHMNAMAFSTLACVLSGGCLMVLDRFHPRPGGARCASRARRSCTTSVSCRRC